MREFLHGWRRKVGCVTLLMACIVMGLWVRSRFYDDDFRFRSDKQVVQVVHLFENELSWTCVWEPDDGPRVVETEDGKESFAVLIQEDKNVDWNTVPRHQRRERPFDGIRWSWNVGVCRYGNQSTDPLSGVGFRVFMIPCWSLILCLTTLSAYLIFWKPRKQSAHA